MASYPIESLPSYLEISGWQLERRNAGRQVWRHGSGVFVYVPLEVGSDYSDLTALATLRIAEVEGRDVGDVAVDLTYMAFDKMHVRRETPHLGLRLEDGLEFHKAVHDTVLAAALAEAAGIHWTYVGQIERGRRNVTLHNILKLASGLGVDAGELVAGLEAIAWGGEA